jgi:hypothetical protein
MVRSRLIDAQTKRPLLKAVEEFLIRGVKCAIRPWSANVNLSPAWPRAWALTRAHVYVESGIVL